MDFRKPVRNIVVTYAFFKKKKSMEVYIMHVHPHLIKANVWDIFQLFKTSKNGIHNIR